MSNSGAAAKINPNANITVIVKSARILKAFDGDSKMDSYVRVSLGKQIYETSISEDGGNNLMWNANTSTFGFLRQEEKFLRCEAYYEDFFRDDLIGLVDIDITDLLRTGAGKGEKETVYEIKEKNGQKAGDITMLITASDGKRINVKNFSEAVKQAEEESKQAKIQAKESRDNNRLASNASNQPTNLLWRTYFLHYFYPQREEPNITMRIIEASIIKDMGTGEKLDKYFVMKMGTLQRFETKVASEKGVVLKWLNDGGASFGFIRTTEKTISLELWEDDNVSGDELLGVADLDVEEIFSKRLSTFKYPVMDQQMQTIAEVSVEIIIDDENIQGDPVKQQKEITALAKKAEEVSLINQAERKFNQQNPEQSQQHQQPPKSAGSTNSHQQKYLAVSQNENLIVQQSQLNVSSLPSQHQPSAVPPQPKRLPAQGISTSSLPQSANFKHSVVQRTVVFTLPAYQIADYSSINKIISEEFQEAQTKKIDEMNGNIQRIKEKLSSDAQNFLEGIPPETHHLSKSHPLHAALLQGMNKLSKERQRKGSYAMIDMHTLNSGYFENKTEESNTRAWIVSYELQG